MHGKQVMKLFRRLWSYVTRERVAEEKKTDELFKAQIQEALLRQDDLREAAAQMKKLREGLGTEEEKPFRSALSSRPT